MKKYLILLLILAIAVSMSFMGVGCREGAEEVASKIADELIEEEKAVEEEAPAAEAEEEEIAEEPVEMVKITIGLSPYQDVSSLIVAEEKGFFEKYGLEPEFIPIDWGGAIELLAAESVDFANMSDTDLGGKHENIPNIVFTNLLYLWEANMLVGQKDTDMTTFEEFKNEGMSDSEAAFAACAQISGKAAVVARKHGQEAFLRDCASYGGLDYDEEIDPYIIDMQTEEGLPAFMGGDGDIFLPGIPQIHMLTTEGYPVLIRLRDIPVPGMVVQAGFGTYKKFAEENWDVVVRFQAVIFDTLDFIDQNPMESFKIITDYLNAQTAAGMEPEDLRDLYWNKLEYFPLAEESYNMTILEDGSRYWKSRWEQVFKQFLDAEVISSMPDVSEINLWPKVMEDYLKQYNPELHDKLSS